MADGYLNFDTKINESGFNEGINKLGSLGKSGLSVVSKKTYSQVPRLLKDKVKEVLIDSGAEDLVTEDKQ